MVALSTSGASRLSVLLAIGSLAAVSVGQINVSSRTSTQRYVYTHGGGPDVHNDDQTFVRTTLLTSDSMQTIVHDATAGTWATHDWDTSVSATLNQEYAMTGTATNASRIVSGANVDLSTTGAGDIATAGINTTNPGNELRFYFSMTSDAAYNLTGDVTGGSDAFSYVALQRFDGFVWQYMFASFFTPGENVNWNVSGVLHIGESYRLTSVLADGVGINQSHGKSLHYDLTVVPEPASAACLGAGLLALAFFRRKKTV